jgi:AraC family transcriptional regulator, transcriptional activator of pobA
MSEKNIDELLDNFNENQDLQIPIDYMDSDILFIEELESLPRLYSSKLKANVICSCVKGKMELDVNGTHYVVNEGCAVICPSGSIVDNILVSPDFKFMVLCLTDRIIQSLLAANMNVWNRAVYVRKEHMVMPPSYEGSDKHLLMGWHFMEIVRSLLAFKDNPFRGEMIRSMLQIVLLSFCARQTEIEKEEQTLPSKAVKSPQGQALFSRFVELLREEEIKHRPVYYYAEKLYVSAKYLSYVCKEVSGKSANDFIQTSVMDEIVHYLKNTALSVKEIANRLGFPNVSFFGKYVKAHLGVSPNEYRKRHYETQVQKLQ